MSSSRSVKSVLINNCDQGRAIAMSPQMTGVHLIDISLHARNRRDWGSKENVAATEIRIENQKDRS